MARITEMISNTVDSGFLTGIAGKFDLILYASLFALILFYFMRFVQHKREVKIYQKYKNGYIRTTNRYAYAVDKNSNIEYLRPIFGRRRLPYFNEKYWQKTKGLPVIGVNKTINLLKVNEYTYKPISIKVNLGEIEIVEHESNLGYVFMNEYHEFLKEHRKMDKYYLFSIIAPICVILGAITFWIIAILLQVNLEREAAESIKYITEVLINYVK